MSTYTTLLESTLHSEIPITQAIGISVETYHDNALTLRAPLNRNINHKLTAFGGSLYSVAVLTGWGLLFLKLKEHQLSGHIVIMQSEMQYLEPVTTDIVSTCVLPDRQTWDKFVKLFERHHRARVKLDVSIMADQTEKARFTGYYVVHH